LHGHRHWGVPTSSQTVTASVKEAVQLCAILDQRFICHGTLLLASGGVVNATIDALCFNATTTDQTTGQSAEVYEAEC
jgi:hypothetical protein